MGKDTKSTLVTVAHCPLCKDYVFSRTKRDFRSCSCEAVSIDGGTDYIKLNWVPNIKREQILLYDVRLNLTKEELYDDWNNAKDQYGIIKDITKEEVIEQQ